jgi:hypothetical protein
MPFMHHGVVQLGPNLWAHAVHDGTTMHFVHFHTDENGKAHDYLTNMTTVPFSGHNPVPPELKQFVAAIHFKSPGRGNIPLHAPTSVAAQALHQHAMDQATYQAKQHHHALTSLEREHEAAVYSLLKEAGAPHGVKPTSTNMDMTWKPVKKP